MRSLLVVIAGVALVVGRPGMARAEEEAPPTRVSPNIALLLATGLTAAGGAALFVGSEAEDGPAKTAVLMVAAGLYVVGPSAGHLYAGESGSAVGMSLVRAGSLGIVYLGFTRAIEDCENDACGERHGELILLGGAGLWAAATVYDLIDSSRAAARTNARMRLVPTGSGVAVAGRF